MTLTRYTAGSFRELCTIALPLMLSALSVTSMFFVDRLFIAQYATDALTATVNASTQGWVFIAVWMVLCGMSEVFVAQYNGAKEKEFLGHPVWQMIWVSLLSTLFFVPLAYTGPLFFGEGIYENTYFFWIVSFGASYALYASVAGFFIGQGKTLLVTLLAVVTNIFNAVFDWILIFGMEGWFPEMGVKGAAIATTISSLFQFLVLFAIFLNKKNRTECGTSAWQWNSELMWKCLKVGVPSAILVFAEVEAWAMFYAMMTQMGHTYITIVGIAQSMVIFLYFFADGLYKAATTLVGNYIGAGRLDLIPKVMQACLKLNLLFLAVMMGAFLLWYDSIVNLFLPGTDPAFIAHIENALHFVFFCDLIYLFFEGLRMQYIAQLTAAGDTVFTSVAGISCVWLFLVLPIYYCFLVLGLPVEAAGLIIVGYSFLATGVYYFRYLQGAWKDIHLLDKELS